MRTTDKSFQTPWIDELKELWDKRDPHVQQFLETLIPERPEFHGTQFIAYIVNDIKTRPNGETVLQLTIPFEFREEALELTKALTVPLSVDIQIWKIYEEAVNGRSRLAEPPPDSDGEKAE